MIGHQKSMICQGYAVRTLDLFCGAGLSSSGARAAGVTMVGAIDLSTVATQTYSHNFPNAEVINKRLEDVRPSQLRAKIGDIDLLLASPECTNHTCAKGAAPRSELSRATAMQVLRYAKAFEPRWIVMENVVHMRPWSRYPELIKKLGGLGYNVREQVLDSSEFGVAQKRRRLFVICDREAVPAEIKPPVQEGIRQVRHILDMDDRWRTTPLFRKGRAKDTLARAKRAIAELGEDQPFLIVYYGTDGCGGWQSLDRPLRTITTVDRFALVRPTEHGYRMRMLQVPELMRAMGLDDQFEMPAGTRRDKIRLLGNGVCPPVMQRVVASLSN
jgi:DNA (cytosine-5)-methyltransferase 1